VDIVYLSVAAVLWLAMWGLAVGCDRLHDPGSRS
jgi:hypothetical protein